MFRASNQSVWNRVSRAAVTTSVAAIWAAGLATLAAASGCQGPEPFIRGGPSLIKCTISRQECEIYDVSGKQCIIVNSNLTPDFPGDVCYDSSVDHRAPSDICQAKYCVRGPDAPGTCVASGALVLGATGPICSPLPAGGNVTLFANVSWTVHGEACDVPTGTGNQCVMIPKNESHKDCEDVGPFLNPAGVETMKAPPLGWISRAVHIDPIDTSVAAQCTPPQPSQRFQFAGSPIATATGGGTTASISAVRGLATVGQSCGSDGCFPASLDAFNVDLADMTVAGTALTNLSVSLTQSAPLVDMVDDAGNGFQGIVTDALELRVVGKKAGVDSYFSARNKTSWRVDTSATGLRLQGNFGIVNFGPDGSPLPVIINVDASGVPATAQTLACANASPISRLFGFEAGYTWTSTSSAGTLSLVTSPLTQGCAALGLRGQGFMPIDSAPFSTRGLVTNAAASVDLFVPSNQPNQFWQGQLQLYLSCPSGNFFHQFVGQADVTGRPQNRFSTMRIPLTSAARTVLGRTLDDCSFQYALNVNGTNRTWVFDNLRFTP